MDFQTFFSSNEDSCQGATTKKPRFLERLGYLVVSFLKCVYRKARTLPNPLGSSINNTVEAIVNPWAQQLLTRVEIKSLNVLCVADNQLHTISDAVLAHMPLASVIRSKVELILSGQALDIGVAALEKIGNRGFVGAAADVWVEYEPLLKANSLGVVYFAESIGFKYFVRIVHDYGTPLLSLASNWLHTHSNGKKDEKFHFEIVMATPGTNETCMNATFSTFEDTEDKGTTNFCKESTATSYEPSEVPTEDDTTSVPISVEGKLIVEEEQEAVPSSIVPTYYDEDSDEDQVLGFFELWSGGPKGTNPRGQDSLVYR